MSTSPNLIADTLAVLSRRIPSLAWVRDGGGSIKGSDAPTGTPNPPTYSIVLAKVAGSHWRVQVWMCAIDADATPMRFFDYTMPFPSAEGLACAVLAAVHEYGRAMEERAREMRALMAHAQRLWMGARP